MSDIIANKYLRLKRDLEEKGEGSMKCFGPSMLPLLPTASVCYYIKSNDYKVGDIVFCKVNGRFIDSHLITKKGRDGRYMISNNHGHDNGWTRTIYGKVIKSVDNHGNIKEFI